MLVSSGMLIGFAIVLPFPSLSLPAARDRALIAPLICSYALAFRLMSRPARLNSPSASRTWVIRSSWVTPATPRAA
jgi:hypothetical protein